MKTVLIIIMGFMLGTLNAQQHTETIKRELAFEQFDLSNVFFLANISGSVTAEAHAGTNIILEAKLTVRAKTESRLERAKNELGLGVIDLYDTLIVFIKGPCEQFDRAGRKYKPGTSNRWGYNWTNCDYRYDFRYDFTLKIPQSLNVYLSTINDGDIEINGLKGALELHNVNGSISVKEAVGETYARTINGDVTLDYTSVPSKQSYFYTLNGDINAYFPGTLKADVTFKSFNGDIYTDYPNIEKKPMLLAKNERVKKEGVSFKVEAKSVISFGGGGVTLGFETFNGDAYIRKKQ